MPWREDWRSEERPNAEAIPDEYGLTTSVTDNPVMGYFAGVLVFSYLALKFVGTKASLVAGVPVLIWLTVGVSVLIIAGLYVSLTKANASEDLSKMKVDQGAKDD